MRGVVAAVLVVLAAAVTAGSSPAREPGGRPPDLVLRAPYDLELTSAGLRWRLGFASAAANVGAGPLIVQGRRRPGEPTMTAVQELRSPAGAHELVAGAGRLRYVVSPDHAHWHLTPFMRYELRPAGRPGRVVRDRKTGFCLGDRYDTGRRLPGKPAEMLYTGRCGLREPGRLGVRQGISVGYGDDYDPTLEGQFVDITGLPAGRYLLVHRVNKGRTLREARYDNNASSLLLQLRWRDGRPSVEQLRRCPGREFC
jgi:hypothetical protein